MKNCVNLKQKMNRTIYCKKLNKQIDFACNCSNCSFKEFKSYKQLQAKSEYKYKPKKGKCSNYHNDISIMPPSTLYSTKKVKGTQKHHVFGGVANRPKSEKYGLFIWLIQEQHNYLHNHPKEMLSIKKEAQKSFMKYYDKTVEEFRSIFGRNWL